MKPTAGDTDTLPERQGGSRSHSACQGEPGGATPPNVFWHSGKIPQQFRHDKLGCCPATVWLTGLSGAGKSTIAYELEMLLLGDERHCCVLDGDNMRHRLNSDLGFSANDRKENIRRAAEVARLMNEAGLVVVASFISPFRDDRAMASAIIGKEHFIEVHVSTPVEVCELRDPKGLYAKARAGQIGEFTGITAPYEPPPSPALVLDTGAQSATAAAHSLYSFLQRRFI